MQLPGMCHSLQRQLTSVCNRYGCSMRSIHDHKLLSAGCLKKSGALTRHLD